MNTTELKQLVAKIDRIRSLERQVRAVNELACNQELTERQETRRDRLENEFTGIAKSLGLVPEHHRDPRGSALKLHDQGANIDSATGTVI